MTRGTIDMILYEKFEGKEVQEGSVEAKYFKYLIDSRTWWDQSGDHLIRTGSPWYYDAS